jgi:hypothetical protein
VRWVEIERFDGGYVHLDSLGIGDESLNMIRYGQNIRCRSGEVKARDGISIYSDFSAAPSITGKDIEALYEYSRESFSGGSTTIWHALVFTFDDEIWYVVPADDPDVAAQIATGLSTDDCYMLTIYDHLFVANGQDDLKVWDGTNWFNAGIAAPAVAPTVVVNNAGALYRKYKYTFYRDADPYSKESGESDEVTASLIAVNPDNDITYAVSADAQVNRYRIYATASYADPLVPETDFFLMAERTSAQAAAEGYVYNDTAISFTGAAYDTTDRGYPPQIKYMLWHDGRIFAAGEEANPSIIYYSAPGKPFYWPEANWDEVSRDDGDVITALGAIGATRFIFKKNSIHEWTGDPESATPIRHIETRGGMNLTRLAIGCADPRSLCSWGQSLIFRAGDGHVYMITMNDIVKLSEYIEADIQFIGDGAEAVIYDDYYVINSGDSVSTLVCDLKIGKFGWQGYDTGININCFCVDHENRVLATRDDKLLHVYDSSVILDEGGVMTKIFQPAFIKSSRAMTEGIFRKVIAECRSRDCNFDMSMYNENGIMDDTDDTLYKTTDRFFDIDRGYRGNYMGARFVWTGTAIITSVSMGFNLGRRH